MGASDRTTTTKIRVHDGTDGKFTVTAPGREPREFEVKNGVVEVDAADIDLVLSGVTGSVDEPEKAQAATPTG